jgi:hypothetical protein
MEQSGHGYAGANSSATATTTDRKLVQRFQQQGGNVSAAWEDVERIVTEYRDHSALLGWYVCDDCMTSWIVAQRTAGTPTVDHV